MRFEVSFYGPTKAHNPEEYHLRTLTKVTKESVEKQSSIQLWFVRTYR